MCGHGKVNERKREGVKKASDSNVKWNAKAVAFNYDVRAKTNPMTACEYQIHCVCSEQVQRPSFKQAFVFRSVFLRHCAVLSIINQWFKSFDSCRCIRLSLAN